MPIYLALPIEQSTPGFANSRVRALPHVHPRGLGSRPSSLRGLNEEFYKKSLKQKSYGTWKIEKVILHIEYLVRTALSSAVRAHPEVEVRSARSVRARTGAAAGRGSGNLGGGLERPPLVRNGLLSPVPRTRRRRPSLRRRHRHLRRRGRRRRRARASSRSRAPCPCPCT